MFGFLETRTRYLRSEKTIFGYNSPLTDMLLLWILFPKRTYSRFPLIATLYGFLETVCCSVSIWKHCTDVTHEQLHYNNPGEKLKIPILACRRSVQRMFKLSIFITTAPSSIGVFLTRTANSVKLTTDYIAIDLIN